MITVPPAYSEAQAVAQYTQPNNEMSGFNQNQGQGIGQVPQAQVSYFGGCSPAVCFQAVPAPYNAVNSHYKSRQSILVGVAQIIVGVLCIAFNATGIGLYLNGSYIAYGIWGGVLLIVAGGFGISAGTKKTKCPIIAFMVLSIISAVAAACIFSIAIVGSVNADERKRYCENYYSYSYGYGYRYYRDCSMYPAMLAMGVLLAILGGIAGILSIWGSVLGCKGLCGRHTSSNNYVVQSQPVQMMTTNGTPHVVYFTTPAAGPQYTAYPGYPMQLIPNQQIQMVPNPHMVPSSSVTYTPPVYQPPAESFSGHVNNAFVGETTSK